MTAKYDFSQATFNMPVAAGDNSKVMIEKFSVYLDTKNLTHSRAEELKILIRDIQRVIAEDSQIDNQRKVEATNVLAQVTNEVSSGARDNQKDLTYYWSKFVDLIKDSSTVISFTRDLARLLGMTVP